MPLSEQAIKNKTRYKNEYAKAHYKRIPLDVTLDKYEQIKTASEELGETVNGYIKKAIDNRLNDGNA